WTARSSRAVRPAPSCACRRNCGSAPEQKPRRPPRLPGRPPNYRSVLSSEVLSPGAGTFVVVVPAAVLRLAVVPLPLAELRAVVAIGVEVEGHHEVVAVADRQRDRPGVVVQLRGAVVRRGGVVVVRVVPLVAVELEHPQADGARRGRDSRLTGLSGRPARARL